MSKRLILILALAFVVGIAFTAYAEVQNVKVSGDIQLTGAIRSSLTLKDNQTVADFGENLNNLLSQVRVKVDADLTDNVSTTVRLINERVWGPEADASNGRADNTDITVDLAYATLKEFLYSPLTLTAGRQNLRFGNGLIIGDPDTNGIAAGHGTANRILPNSLDDLSLRKSFDAIRATLDYNPLVVDLIYSKIDENGVAISDDTDLFGANATYAFDKNLTGELYTFQRSRKSSSGAAAGAVSDRERLRTSGARVAYTGIKNLVLGVEGAFQYGDHLSSATLYPDENTTPGVNRHRKVRAYAGQAVAQYVMPEKKYTPALGASYTYLSGDKYLSDSDNFRGWDPMFEDQGGGTLFNKIFGYSNAQLFNVNGSAKPIQDLTVALNYWYLRLNQPFTSGQPAAGVTLSGVYGDPTYITKDSKKGLGHEVDVMFTYDYTEDVQFALNTGAFIPGGAFDKRNDKVANQVIGSMKVTF